MEDAELPDQVMEEEIYQWKKDLSAKTILFLLIDNDIKKRINELWVQMKLDDIFMKFL